MGNAYHGKQGQLLPLTRRPVRPIVVLLLAAFSAGVLSVASAEAGQSIRARIRGDRGTTITKSQAEELTLTVSEASVRPIQTWIRTAGPIDPHTRTVTVTLNAAESAVVKNDQRVRAFPPEARSSMYQARVTRVEQLADGRARVGVTLIAPPREGSTNYVLEIVADYGEALSVPNEAIIEEGDRRVVYVERADGSYAPTVIQTGAQGELYTQVTGGLKPGDRVVTFGSFFIDSEYKLKGSAQVGP